ncbi:histidine-containing phosphotransfer protein 1-like isoform X2 [Rhododendron vialii]|uniref:histidine-containing phosphotransfer protein 1-like isoform X2 n=1 Tax=Rhododendron vialii TaxID=182163 RepID=UPI00265ED810|nr:histidine-containing phosphotransfer protein 1-like isoform X2 [Rhododendron vialii]
MDLVSQMQRQFVDYKNSLFREGFLDDQFKQLLQLQDESNPGFVVEVVSLFFQDSEKLLNNLATAFIGALKVKNECVAFRNYCDEKNRERCEKCLEQLKREYIAVKNKLGTLFQMERHILLRGGSIPLE